MKRHFVWLLAGLMLIGLSGLASISLAEEGKWMRKADMPTARDSLSTSVVDGKIYAIGGWGKTSAVEEYDPLTDKWTKKADMPTPRADLSASAVNDKIYAIGGWGPSGFVSTVEEYDPRANTWTKKASMPTARAGFSTSVVNGKIYAMGGEKVEGGNGIVVSAVEEYDPKTDKWTKKADMLTPRYHLSTSVVNGKIYAIGGSSGRGMHMTVDEYDPVVDKWAKKADMPTVRAVFSTSVVSGKIYVIGGGTVGIPLIPLSMVEEYDPVTNKWTKKADMPTPRAYLSTSSLDGKIYAIGGTDNVVKFSTVEEFDPGLEGLGIDAKGKLATSWGKMKKGSSK